jgi:hypothetical protein
LLAGAIETLDELHGGCCHFGAHETTAALAEPGAIVSRVSYAMSLSMCPWKSLRMAFFMTLTLVAVVCPTFFTS